MKKSYLIIGLMLVLVTSAIATTLVDTDVISGFDNLTMDAAGFLKSAGVINVAPSGDTDDYISINTTANVPYINSVGSGGMFITTDGGIITLDPAGGGVSVDGNLGVGTTNPERPLHVNSSGYTGLRISGAGTSTASAGVEFERANSGRGLGNYYYTGSDLEWYAGIPYTGGSSSRYFVFLNGTDRTDLVNPVLTLQQDGTVGVGTMAPAEKLEVDGNIRLTNGGSINTGSGNITLDPAGGDVTVADSSLTIDEDRASSSAFIYIDAEGASYDSSLIFKDNGSNKWTIHRDGSDNDALKFYDYASTTDIVTLEPNGDITFAPASGVVAMSTTASAPASCTVGDLYFDTSGAFCACTATNTWSNTVATGSCA